MNASVSLDPVLDALVVEGAGFLSRREVSGTSYIVVSGTSQLEEVWRVYAEERPFSDAVEWSGSDDGPAGLRAPIHLIGPGHAELNVTFVIDGEPNDRYCGAEPTGFSDAAVDSTTEWVAIDPGGEWCY